MYKKSYFRGLGTGLVIGALTMTVAFNFGNAGKTDSGQGKTAVVSQQQDKSTEDSSTETTTEKKTEDKTTEKVTTEKNANADKTTTETGKSENGKSDAESGSGNVADNSGVNSKGDVYTDGSSSDNKTTSDSSTGSDTNSGSGSNSGTTGSSDKSNGTGTTDNNGGLSDKTERVPSAKDNGYTEDKNSPTGSGSSTNKTTEAATEAVKASAIKYDNGGGEITFGAGTSAYEICQLLGQIGIRDADEYYDWLLRSGYSESLVPGTYTFTGNETNGGIVWILLGHQ